MVTLETGAVRRMRVGLRLLVLCTALGTACVFAAPATASVLRPGVLFDAEAGRLYVMSPDGRLEALDAAGGPVVWRTARAARPLELREGQLLAQAETSGRGAPLEVVLLDAAAPESGGIQVRIPLPATVDPSIDDGPGSRFLTSGELDGDVVTVSWSFCELAVSGVDPGALGGEACLDGSFRFDRTSGEGEAIEPGASLPPPLPPLPERLTRLVEAGRLPGRLWRSDGLIVATREERSGATRKVWLQRFDAASGEPLAEVLLYEDGGERIVRYPSADGRHLLASGPDPASGAGLWRWAVYDLATGELAGKLVHDSVGARFVVLGTSLVHDAPRQRRRVGDGWVDQPLRLRAVSLATGDVLWTRPVRDPTWWGPMAPTEPSRPQDAP